MPRDTLEWKGFISEAKPDTLILADWWGVGNRDRNDKKQFENVVRMSTLATVARDSGVKTIIGVGSQAELGPISNLISEDLPDNPTTEYGHL
jgi:nucleoside-diphosphate-sugar epimerase